MISRLLVYQVLQYPLGLYENIDYSILRIKYCV